jgi:predicted nucleic acid-binding protein
VIVVDASALVEVLLGLPMADDVGKRLFEAGQSLHVPHLIDVEILQVVRRYAVGGEISLRRAAMAVDDLADLRLNRYAHDVLLPRAWDLRNNLTAYDAVYVALAELMDVPLLTRDRRLAAASGHRAQIELV